VVFLLREALNREPGNFEGFVRSQRGPRIPTVLTKSECQLLFSALEGTFRLMAELMYGAGLRLTELLMLWFGRLSRSTIRVDGHQLRMEGIAPRSI
jgi:site-specific recombinase XerD